MSVIKRAFEMTGFDKGHVTNYKILEIRQVRIRGSLPDLYTAALVRTGVGEKIVLFQYQLPAFGWWSRIVDANREKTDEIKGDKSNHGAS